MNNQVDPLQALHDQVTRILAPNDRYSYLSSTKINPSSIFPSRRKDTTLAEVFNVFRGQIENIIFARKDYPSENNEHVLLQALRNDGELLYNRYQSKRTWTRWFFYGIGHYAYSAMHRIYSIFFSMVDRRPHNDPLETHISFQEFRNYLDLLLDQHKANNDEETPNLPFVNPTVIIPEMANTPMANVPPTSLSGKEATKTDSSKGMNNNNQAKESAHYGDVIRYCMQALINNIERPLSFEKFKFYLSTLSSALSQLKDIESNSQELLTKMGIEPGILPLFTSNDMITAILTKNDDKINELLATSAWQVTFNTALLRSRENSYILIAVQNFMNEKSLRLANNEGQRVRETDFIAYTGEVRLTIDGNQESTDSLIDALLAHMDKNELCRPYRIMISCDPAGNLTPEFFQILMRLKDRFGEVRIEGLLNINFHEIGVTQKEELDFVKALDQFQFPNLAQLTLSKHPKKNWTQWHMLSVLLLCSSVDLLKEYIKAFPNSPPFIPPSLADLEEFDAEGLNYTQTLQILAAIPSIHTLTLGSQNTFGHLRIICNDPQASHLRTLRLSNCVHFTTDILPFLAGVMHLTRIDFPENFSSGTTLAKNLPTVSNPFRIKMLYSNIPMAQRMADQLYVGPQNWAAVYQIPLARSGVTEIFGTRQGILIQEA